MLLGIYILRWGTDIVAGLLVFFPLIYLLTAIIHKTLIWELLTALALLSASFLLPVNICFNMGTCIPYALVYIALALAAFGIKELIIIKKHKKEAK